MRVGDLAEAANFARQAIRETALSSAAFQTLALTQDGAEGRRNVRLFRYTSQLSRRQVPSQVWLLQHELLQGNPEDALRRLDGALRVSKESHEILFPFLATIMAIDSMSGPIATLLSSEPRWLGGFLGHVFRQRAALDNLTDIVLLLPEESAARSPNTLSSLMRTLVAAQKMGEAVRVLHAIDPEAVDDFIRNPSFIGNGQYGPFGWNYANRTQLHSSPTGNPEGGLQYVAETGHGGVVASQVLTLLPGQYQLSTLARSMSGEEDSVFWRIRCSGPRDVLLVELPISDTSSGTRPRGSTFDVPENDCSTQWLELALRANFSPGGAHGIIDVVQIRPRSSRQP